MNPVALKPALVGVLALVLLTAGATWKVQDWRYGKQLNGLESARVQGIAETWRIAREEEQRRQAAADEVEKNAREQLEQVEIRAVAAESAAGGLRGEIVRLRNSRTATCSTISAQQRQAGSSAIMVLGGLLEEADRMAGSLAEALERSRIAGQACELTYSRL
jgi:hypothetical protein